MSDHTPEFTVQKVVDYAEELIETIQCRGSLLTVNQSIIGG